MPDVFLDCQVNIATTVGPVNLTRVHPFTATVPLAVTVAADLVRVHLFTVAVSIVARALGQLFYAPAIDPVPAGLPAASLKVLTMSMPAPTLDAYGRPEQPWAPS